MVSWQTWRKEIDLLVACVAHPWCCRLTSCPLFNKKCFEAWWLGPWQTDLSRPSVILSLLLPVVLFLPRKKVTESWPVNYRLLGEEELHRVGKAVIVKDISIVLYLLFNCLPMAVSCQSLTTVTDNSRTTTRSRMVRFEKNPEKFNRCQEKWLTVKNSNRWPGSGRCLSFGNRYLRRYFGTRLFEFTLVSRMSYVILVFA